jgi:hypothetical protein
MPLDLNTLAAYKTQINSSDVAISKAAIANYYNYLRSNIYLTVI